jgi:hypothetical protein
VKPAVSKPVIVIGSPANGTFEHPGLISRVWDDETVNVVVFPDGGGEPYFERSIPLFKDREQALAFAPGRRCAFWA